MARVILLVAVFFLVNCTSNEKKAKPNQTQFEVIELIKYSKSHLGIPHKMGGITKNGMDCSGFVKLCFGEFGIQLPHSSNEQSKLGTRISGVENLKMGDIVFFKNTYTTNKPITHSGIYLGNKEFIHVSTKKGVIISSIDDPYYWKERFVFGSRMLTTTKVTRTL